MKILIYGSTYLTEVVAERIEKSFEVVGYVPCVGEPTVPGRIRLKKITNPDKVKHDIKLSLQYDRKILELEGAYNLHTGLLPEWGGVDILYHTIKEEALVQGLTFHGLSERYDEGPIVSRVEYPVNKTDTIVSLYEKMVAVAPGFMESCLSLLPKVSIGNCPVYKPKLFKRGQIDPKDEAMYRMTKSLLRKRFRR